MKHEWRKVEKQFYLPKNKPEKLVIPEFKFFAIQGKGNPNEEFFAAYIEVLYALSYAIRMAPKAGIEIPGYVEYTVYPLEGVWDVSEYAKQQENWVFDKNELVFNLMIRQPDFVNDAIAAATLERTQKKKPLDLLDQVKFIHLEEGSCVQMLHLGSYDDEPKSFEMMENFAKENQLTRKSKIHREIYLSDPRKTPVEKLKTVLRFEVGYVL